MPKSFSYSTNLSKKAEILMRDGKKIGEGHNGIVFLLPENQVIKIFKSKSVLRDESSILHRTKKSRYYPKIYEVGDYYIIREYIEGERLDKYLKTNDFTRDIAAKLYDLTLEFDRLHFKRKDLRCKDIFIDKDMNIRIIDPKNNYDKHVSYPRHLMKGLDKVGALNDFLAYVKEKDRKKYCIWKDKMTKYLMYHIK